MGDHWELLTSQTKGKAILEGDSVVTPFICILNFKWLTKSQKQSCIIFFDAMQKDDYRKLLVLLRMG